MKTDKKTDKPASSVPPPGKHSVAYWREKVYRPVAKGTIVPNYAVRLWHGGKERRLSLSTPNREAAASLGKEMYLFLSTNGWEACRERYRAAGISRRREIVSATKRGNVTIGDFLTAVLAESDLGHKTVRDYAVCLRYIVAGIKGLESNRHRFDYRNGGRAKWVAKIDAVPLADVIPDAIRVWKRAYVNEAGNDELTRRRRTVSCNSYLRRARALFSRSKVLSRLKSIQLPRVLPFDGVTLEPRTDTKFYGAGVDPMVLVRTALDELEIEPLKAFLLGITLGLRRREMDLLEWQSFDFVSGTLRIMPTRWYKLKTNESSAELPVEPEILELFRGWRARATSEFVLESEGEPKVVSYQHYRCQETFKALLGWLRENGVQGNKPLHALRKLYGSAIADMHGLHAASSALRHADIRTTSAFYADRRVKVVPGFGQAVLGPEVVQVFPRSKIMSERERKEEKRKTRRRPLATVHLAAG